MPHEDTQEESQALGAFLRDHREQKGVSLADVSEATKISLPVLEAIEEDDHESMPAEAFCRGFYSMYADYLGLNQNKILERYTECNELTHKAAKKQAKPPVKKSQRVSNYAEPHAISPGISIIFITVICLILITGICYYVGWNPIDYIKTKLTPPQTAIEQQQSQPIPDTPAMTADEPVTEVVAPDTNDRVSITKNESETVSPETLPLSILSAPDDDNIEQLPETSPTEETTVAPYQLEMAVNNSGTLKVTLDDGFVLDKHFAAGETLQWKVKKKIILDMPGTISGNLRLNGITIPLPQEENGRRMLFLPEDLLD